MSTSSPTPAATCSPEGIPHSLTLHIAVGTENPSKLRSVRNAFDRVLKRHPHTTHLHIQGVSVKSGVPHQPFGDKETKQGAMNRAKHAFAAYEQKFDAPPHFSIGLEGGLDLDDGDREDERNELWCMAWMAVYGKRSKEILQFTASSDSLLFEEGGALGNTIWGLAKTACFALPSKIVDLVTVEGMELGDADDHVFSRVKSKHGSGTIGLLTDGLIDRSAYYEHALVLALIPWVRPDLYPKGSRV